MSRIGRAHRALARIAPKVAIDVLASDDVQEAIRREVEASPPRRESPLHPSLVIWLTLAMALYRVDSIPNVFARLLAGWRESRTWIALRVVTDGALAHARGRLGSAPLRRLFESMASLVTQEPTFHGRRVWSLDGSVLSVPDTPSNERAFGRHRASRGHSAFPQLRLLTLSTTRTHEIRAARWIPYPQSELSAAWDLLQILGQGALVLLDRGFMAVWLWARLADQGVEFVARVRSPLRPRVLARRGPGDFDVEVRSSRPQDCRDGRRLKVRLRLIEYRIGRGPLVRLLTNLTDPSISAREIAGLYHERWEVELVFDEIKTHFAAARHGALDLPFRGRSPRMVEQEIWATLVAFNLVRRAIAVAAQVHRVDPRRMSFTDSLVVITATWQARARKGASLVLAYVRFVQDLADCVLDRWRRPRQCPRTVRRRFKPYPHKTFRHRERFHDAAALLHMGRAKCA